MCITLTLHWYCFIGKIRKKMEFNNSPTATEFTNGPSLTYGGDPLNKIVLKELNKQSDNLIDVFLPSGFVKVHPSSSPRQILPSDRTHRSRKRHSHTQRAQARVRGTLPGKETSEGTQLQVPSGERGSSGATGQDE